MEGPVCIPPVISFSLFFFFMVFGLSRSIIPFSHSSSFFLFHSFLFLTTSLLFLISLLLSLSLSFPLFPFSLLFSWSSSPLSSSLDTLLLLPLLLYFPLFFPSLFSSFINSFISTTHRLIQLLSFDPLIQFCTSSHFFNDLNLLLFLLTTLHSSTLIT